MSRFERIVSTPHAAVELSNAARELRRVMLKEKTHDELICCGYGTAIAHAKGKTRDEWLLIWSKAHD